MKSLPFVLVILIACGGAQEGGKTAPTGGGGGSAAKPAAAGDVSIELDKAELKGTLFEPLALGRPGMPLVQAKRKTTLAQQRSIVTNARDPVLKQAQAAVLATMLYEESKINQANEKTLWTEARQALRDAATGAGKDVDEVTLRMLGSYELLFDDYPAAEKAWQALVEKDPKDKDVQYNRAWWAYALLKQAKNADALAVVKNEALSEKHPELAYVTAWAKWRTNDDAGAWDAIIMAAKGWGSNAGRQAVELDVMLFAGRSNLSFKQAMPQLLAVFNAKQKEAQFDVLATLGLKAYQFAGRWADGVAALEEALKVMGTAVPPAVQPIIRYTQADYTVRLDTPEVAAKYAKQAIDALNACPATVKQCGPAEKQNIILAVSVMARLFHIFYATANDIRYYQPANDLYILTIPLIADAKRRTDVNNDADTLQKTLKNTKVGTGTHDKQSIDVLFKRHVQEVQACYEDGLVTNPKLGGTLTLTVESDQTGAIKGVTTSPAGGLQDMAAVATCVAGHAKTWHLPKRGMKGTTRIKATYNLTVAPSPAAAATANAAAGGGGGGGGAGGTTKPADKK